MNPAAGLCTSLSVILLPPGDADAIGLGAEDFALPGGTSPLELLRCPMNPSSASSLAEAKNRLWRAALGEWVLFMVEGSAVPPLEPFTAATDFDLICAGAALAQPGAPDLAPPFAVRRSFLEELNGFSDLPGCVEDFELGLRLHESRARAMRPIGWTRSRPVSPGKVDFEIVLALFYRHPFGWVLQWACDQVEPHIPSHNQDLSARFARIFGRSVPAHGRHSAAVLGRYFAERSDPPFQPAQVITRALESAEAADLYASITAGERRFERSHAANWLMANTTYFQAMTERNIVLRFPPPRLADGLSSPPLSIRMEGRYEVEVNAGVADGLRNPRLSLPLPVACDEQRDLQLFDFEPLEFEQFLDGDRASVNLPLDPTPGKVIRIGYSFRCRVQEGMGGPAGPPPSVHHAKVNARYSAMLDTMMASIFHGVAPPENPRERAGRIHEWILDHIALRWSDRAGLFALEARAGNCAQRVRLFTLLCDRAGLVVRERCGLLAGDLQDKGIHDGEHWASTVRSDQGHPLSHVWAEVFLGDAGWSPMDFLGADSGRRMMTPGNVRDAATRARLRDWTPRLESYYFGNVDPYRIYFGAAPKPLSGIPTGVAGIDLDSIWRVAWGTRHTLRMRLQGLPSSQWEKGG